MMVSHFEDLHDILRRGHVVHTDPGSAGRRDVAKSKAKGKERESVLVGSGSGILTIIPVERL